MGKSKKGKKQKVDDEDSNVYTAERILKKRVVRNQVQYWIKWKGWDNSNNTWVSCC